MLEEFITHYANSYRLPKVQFSEEAFSCLLIYGWPGNARRLENCIRCLTCLQIYPSVKAADLPLLQPSDAPHTHQTLAVSARQTTAISIPDRPLREVKQELVNDLER